MTTGITPKSQVSDNLQARVKEANAAREAAKYEEEQRAKRTSVQQTETAKPEAKTEEKPKEFDRKPPPSASSGRNDGTLASRGIGQLIDVLV